MQRLDRGLTSLLHCCDEVPSACCSMHSSFKPSDAVGRTAALHASVCSVTQSNHMLSAIYYSAMAENLNELLPCFFRLEEVLVR